MTQRKALSNKIRFEVFKRDKFSCQYCGRKSPDIVLNVDHIKPVSKGGTNDLLNLITSCFECNNGKSNKELDDTTELSKQKKQLDDIQEKRNQLEMMYQWQLEMIDIDEDIVSKICCIWETLTNTTICQDDIAQKIRPLIKKYGFDEIIDCMKISVYQYFDYDDITTHKTTIDYIGKICNSKKLTKEKPYMSDLFYCRGILKNRLNDLVEWEALKMLEEMYLTDQISVDKLKTVCVTVSTWYEFKKYHKNFMETK